VWFSSLPEATENRMDDPIENTTVGRVRLRTSTKQRSHKSFFVRVSEALYDFGFYFLIVGYVGD
jgi:hypothetical protein